MRPTEPLRREHAELHTHIEHIAHAAREVPRLDAAERANCERTAYSMRFSLPPGAATFLAPVRPPTPACEHGRMALSALPRT